MPMMLKPAEESPSMACEMTKEFSPTKLRAARDRRGWSELRLADEAKCSPQAIRDLEAGKHQPRARLLAKLVEALNLPLVDDLFDEVI